MIIDIKVSELGEGAMEATIVEWHKGVGDPIEKDAVLVTIMTEKVNIEIESPVSGTVVEILCLEETAVRVGEVIARIEGKA